MRDHVVAVDIGTGSARALNVFDARGRLLAKAEHPIVMNRPRENHAEHDSEDIWSAACMAVRRAMEQSGIAAASVGAIGFDATCSLVVRDVEGLSSSAFPQAGRGVSTRSSGSTIGR